MRIRTFVMAGLGAGAVALALAGCTGGVGSRGDGQGIGQNGGQGFRGARSAQTQQAQAQVVRGYGRGLQAPSADGAAIDPASDRTGRDVADIGTLRTLNGTLSVDGTEWYLDTSDGRYLLHMGNTAFVDQTGIALEEGKQALVKGLVDAEEVSVVSMQLDGKTYAFRSEDGFPLWAGGGRGGGRGAGRGSGAGQGSGAGIGYRT